MNIGKWIKENASTLLTCLGAGGVVATVVLAIKATPKAMDKLQIAQIDKGEDILDGRREGKVVRNDDGSLQLPKLTVLETVQVCWKEYLPTVAVGAGSLVCIFGANALSRRQQASMAAAYTALASAFEGYRDKVKAICGPDTDEMIQRAIEQEKRDEEDDRPPWDEVQTFYLECNGCSAKFFERTMEQVMRAEYEANRLFILKGDLTLNEFLQIMDLPKVEDGDSVGWEEYIGETQFGYRWIDFNHRYFITDDGLTVCSIDMPFEAHSMEELDYDWHMSHLQDIADEALNLQHPTQQES